MSCSFTRTPETWELGEQRKISLFHAVQTAANEGAEGVWTALGKSRGIDGIGEELYSVLIRRSGCFRRKDPFSSKAVGQFACDDFIRLDIGG